MWSSSCVVQRDFTITPPYLRPGSPLGALKVSIGGGVSIRGYLVFPGEKCPTVPCRAMRQTTLSFAPRAKLPEIPKQGGAVLPPDSPAVDHVRGHCGQLMRSNALSVTLGHIQAACHLPPLASVACAHDASCWHTDPAATPDRSAYRRALLVAPAWLTQAESPLEERSVKKAESLN